MTDHESTLPEPPTTPTGPMASPPLGSPPPPVAPLAVPPAPVAPLPVPPAPPARRSNRTLFIVIGVVVVLVLIGGIVSLVSRQNSRFTIVPSASTDGTFHAGDCVTLTSTTVHNADCSSAHDAQIIQVIHGSETCPAGTQEFDVTDNTGNLCLDKGNSSSG